MGKGGELPSPDAVAAALRQGGVAPETAARLAPEILAEAAACRRDPFLAGLLDQNPPPRNEWLLEEYAGPGLIRRGQIDLWAYDGQEWWILDYKTSRPEREEDWDEFIRGEVEKYRPQLLAYREMAARFQGLAPETVRLALYFTACRRAVEL
jgi:ATP-dependent exoDNAse (exonuclease V) beta subunit